MIEKHDKAPDERTLPHADEEAAYLAAAVGALEDRHAAAFPRAAEGHDHE